MCQLKQINDTTRVLKSFDENLSICNGCNAPVSGDILVSLYYEHYNFEKDDISLKTHVWDRINQKCKSCNSANWYIIEICDNQLLNGWPEPKIKSKNITI